MNLDAGRSVLVVIDMQDRLVRAVADADACVDRTTTLLRTADVLDVPVVVVEMNPEKLGPTDARIRQAIGDLAARPKMTFSAMREPAVAEHLAALDRPQAVVVGMETQVCVLQTAMDLLARKSDVFVVADAVGSRRPDARALGLQRMQGAGVEIVTTEMVMFEWLERAGTDAFRQLQPLLKEVGAP
ncbi:MAG: isochorismatase family protein [Geminicoccaceae bacterium]|nr:isochorismatase family protein [Geminicoccaceae bacterium]